MGNSRNSIEEAQGRVVAFVRPMRDGRGIDFHVPFGTGFFINADGYLATNAHVVRAAEQYSNQGIPVGLKYPARFAGGAFSNLPLANAVVLASDEAVSVDDRADVAIIRTGGRLQKEPNFFKLNLQAVRVGTQIAFTGYPLEAIS